MTFDSPPTTAYVWVWLPGAVEPAVAGILQVDDAITYFNYGASYLRRPDAIPIYLPELPLERGRIRPLDGLTVAGCIDDASPDGWGQRVILHWLLGHGHHADVMGLDLLTLLLESGSDRIGALDFQATPDVYEARQVSATLDEMLDAAQLLQNGEPLSPALELALLRGSSIGGARPKALLDAGDRRLIAKFSANADPYPVVLAEAAAMSLAHRVGLRVAPTEVTTSLGRDVLLVERFDRTAVQGERRMLVSALTILGLGELGFRYATYPDLADKIRERFTEPDATLHELFSRITFNICVSNTDDHARNHSAFWDGSQLSLTPAYDICPQLRTGGEAVQAMAIDRQGAKFSSLLTCVNASSIYHLSKADAREIIDHQIDVIRAQWSDASDEARLPREQQEQLWGRQILNPYALQGY